MSIFIMLLKCSTSLVDHIVDVNEMVERILSEILLMPEKCERKWY